MIFDPTGNAHVSTRDLAPGDRHRRLDHLRFGLGRRGNGFGGGWLNVNVLVLRAELGLLLLLFRGIDSRG